MKYVAVLVTLVLVGCGGMGARPASIQPVVSSPLPAPPPAPMPNPPPPPPAPTPTPTPPPAPSPTFASHYQVIGLAPLPGGTASQANAVSGGHAAGYSMIAGVPEVTLWENGEALDLGAGDAQGINSKDQLVGYLTVNGMPQAMMWDHGTSTTLGSLSGFDSSIASGINDSGEIAGVVFLSANPNDQVGFTWTQQTGMQAIPGIAYATGIDSNGDISGMTPDLRAAIFTASGITNLGTLGDFSTAISVNTQGHAVGYSPLVSGGNVHAFFYNGTMQDLGTLVPNSDTTAVGINENDIVAGYSVLNYTALPWVWSVSGGMVNLNTLITDSAWSLVTASGIDEAGDIVGAGVTGNVVQGFMLVPGS